VGRAERLLTPFPDAPERALLALTQAVTALDIGEVDAGLPRLEEALELAERHDDREVLAMARVVTGRLLIHQGSVDEGLALLDESSTAALSGELGPLVSGLVTATRSPPARTWATTTGRWSGPRPRTGGATGSTSPASRGRAGCTRPR
jgi:hypothetical protein